jgi:hypothetical protein
MKANMNANHDHDALIQLAAGALSLQARAELAARALKDPALVRELKLAMRLAQPAARLASEMVLVSEEHLALRRPFLFGQRLKLTTGLAAGFAMIALISFAPRHAGRVDEAPKVALAHMSDTFGPDTFGSGGGFEGGPAVADKFSGGFEAD